MQKFNLGPRPQGFAAYQTVALILLQKGFANPVIQRIMERKIRKKFALWRPKDVRRYETEPLVG
jgi:hypothetical protein